jgi:hypothetical protein
MGKNYYVYTNSNILSKYIDFVISKSKKKKKNNTCVLCEREFEHEYIYKMKNLSIKILESDIHLLSTHNMIGDVLYKKICSANFTDTDLTWCLISTNNTNIIDGLYEIGSNQIYTQKNKNISESNISRFSEHSGFIYFEKNIVSDIKVITDSRIDKSDPLIYMPKNCLEALNVNYIFHTHPKTPYLGSRIKNGIVYEFPSISDIIHFIDHHNNGKLLGSIVVAPEGLYIIRKNNFNKKNIVIDNDLIIEDLEEVFMECYNESFSKYSIVGYSKLKLNNEIKLPDYFFYEQIATNYEYINKINKVLIKHDLFIDYYARVYFDKSNVFADKWIFNDIYVPMLN